MPGEGWLALAALCGHGSVWCDLTQGMGPSQDVRTDF